MSASKKGGKPNIVLITCDTVRADHMGVMGYSKNITPFLDSLAERGVLFSSAFSASTDTAQSFPAIMTSTYPMDYGGYARMGRPRIMVSEVLQRAGYRTVGLHSVAYLSPYFGYDKGWDTFRFLDHLGEKGMPAMWWEETWGGKFLERVYATHRWFRTYVRFLEAPLTFLKRFVFFCWYFLRDVVSPPPFDFFTAEEMNEEVKKAVSRKPAQPLFLWVHYMDPHTPYGMFLKHQSVRGRAKYFFVNYLLDFLNEYPRINRFFSGMYLSLYDQSLRYVDDALRDLFSHLRAIDVLGANDVAVITSDHGEEFFEHGGTLHAPKLWNTHIHVPLLVLGPERLVGKPRRIDAPRGAVDVPATIADFAGVPKPASYRGQNLFDLKERPVFSETSEHSGMLSAIRPVARCVIEEGYKLIMDAAGRTTLFALSDKGETDELRNEFPEVVRRLERKLKSFRPSR